MIIIKSDNQLNVSRNVVALSKLSRFRAVRRIKYQKSMGKITLMNINGRKTKSKCASTFRVVGTIMKSIPKNYFNRFTGLNIRDSAASFYEYKSHFLHKDKTSPMHVLEYKRRLYIKCTHIFVLLLLA